MFFGIREKDYALGSFTSEKCSACNECETYTFRKTVKYLVAFFINLIPLGTRYSCECESCGDIVGVDKAAGRKIASARFGGKNSGIVLGAAVKIAAVCAVIAAAVVLPLILTAQPPQEPEDLLALVEAEGLYRIQNAEGDTLGIVDVNMGNKSLVYYSTYSRLVGEPGAQDMVMQLNYQQVDGGDNGALTLLPSIDNPGELYDRYDTPVRTYHYDVASEALGYSLGVLDLSQIEYTSGKAVYPFTHFLTESDRSSYVMVIHDEDTRRVTVTFQPDEAGGEALQLKEAVVADFENGQKITEKLYLISETDGEIVFVGAVSPESSADDIVAFIEQSGLTPTYTESYTYYSNTGVVSSLSVTVPDENDMLQTVTEEDHVEEKNGLFVVTRKASDAAE